MAQREAKEEKETKVNLVCQDYLELTVYLGRRAREGSKAKKEKKDKEAVFLTNLPFLQALPIQFIISRKSNQIALNLNTILSGQDIRLFIFWVTQELSIKI